jgi:uncharacterized membrane protein YfcA
MFAIVTILAGAVIGFLLEYAGRGGIIKTVNLGLVVFVVGMTAQAALSGALINAAFALSEQSIARLQSLPLTIALILWVCVMTGYLVGRAAFTIFQQSRKQRPA